MNIQDEKINYGLFLETVETQVRERLGDGFGVERARVLKNNSVELDTVIIREKDETVVPNIFLNNYYSEYQSGRSIESIAGEIVKIYYDNRNRIDVGRIGECLFEELKGNIYYKLVNEERNAKLLEQLPSVRAGDLRLIFSCLVERGNEGIASIRIDNSLAARWNKNAKDLLECAAGNTMKLFPPKIFELGGKTIDMLLTRRLSDESIEDLFGREGDEDGKWFSEMGPNLFVLSNTDGVDGATCIMYPGLAEKIYRRLGGGYFVIPSSVHEVLIVPDSAGVTKEALACMVAEVNASTVPDMDVLSDSVYHYPDDPFVPEL